MACEYGDYNDPRLSPPERETCPWCEQELTLDDGVMWCECGYERVLLDDLEDPAYNYDHLQEDWN